MTPMPVKLTLNKRDRPSRIRKTASNNVPSLRVIFIATSIRYSILPHWQDIIDADYIDEFHLPRSILLNSLVKSLIFAEPQLSQ